MKVAVYSSHKFEKEYLEKSMVGHTLCLFETRLTLESAGLAQASQAVSIFVSDDASAPILQKLHGIGVKYLALRSAGFNHVDLKEANRLGIRVARVPEYSTAAIAYNMLLRLTSFLRGQ